ncbi:glutathione S-transferase family protein [Stagnihabitans tardus]|uniref:Glutathione S-transferase family protein n=1 Tax=Stagnihabitans tardus TaxID=2699202 RepID=A0AAE4YG51_9RHOB|nr:glutathione S-transferase family protein [Stagnihabitans tardus]NBZ89579.1 glutathione S-transferase family protein [Stagnihabitans tardus]
MPVLHWSPRSPYVRKVMVALHEKGMADQVTRVRTPVDPMAPLVGFLPTNPLSKIPTLETDEGQVLFDSHVICRWVDRNGRGGPVLFPGDLIDERNEALGTGLIDVALPWLVETRLRPEALRSQALVEGWRTKMNAVLDWLEARMPDLQARSFDIGHLSIGVALCYLDFRFGAEEWCKGRPLLSAWHAGFSERPSVRATAFQDET